MENIHRIEAVEEGDTVKDADRVALAMFFTADVAHREDEGDDGWAREQASARL